MKSKIKAIVIFTVILTMLLSYPASASQKLEDQTKKVERTDKDGRNKSELFIIKQKQLPSESSEVGILQTHFSWSLYISGLNCVSRCFTTANKQVNGDYFDWLPHGCYVSMVQAGIIQGNSSNYSKVVTDGATSTSLLNNPFQSYYADNTWWIYY